MPFPVTADTGKKSMFFDLQYLASFLSLFLSMAMSVFVPTTACVFFKRFEL